MPRPATDADVFAAIAEPRRRRIIELLAEPDGGAAGRLAPGSPRASDSAAAAHTVSHIVQAIGLPQPAVSKHLAVLRRAGVVSVRTSGRERLYSLNGAGLRRVHEWAATFERFWTDQLHRIKQRAEREALSAPEPSPPAARPGRAPRQTNPKEN